MSTTCCHVELLLASGTVNLSLLRPAVFKRLGRGRYERKRVDRQAGRLKFPVTDQEGTLISARKSRMCKGCWQQLHVPIPLRGIAALPFRAFGIRPSRMNPNICTICEMMFTRVMKARTVTIDATILFADLRGYTSLSQSQSSGAIARLLDAFYDVCGEAIWEHDGIINKTMGDAVMAVFNFPIKHEDHAARAVAAAR